MGRHDDGDPKSIETLKPTSKPPPKTESIDTGSTNETKARSNTVVAQPSDKKDTTTAPSPCGSSSHDATNGGGHEEGEGQQDQQPPGGVCRTGLHHKHNDEASAKEMSEEERVDMLRKRNAVYSKRKYYKKKKEVSNLEATKFQLEAQNQALKAENLRLETLLMQARQKAAALRTNHPSLDLVGGARHGLPGLSGPPLLYPSGSFPYGAMLGSSFGGGGMFPLRTGPFVAPDPYILQRAYLQHNLLQEDRLLGLQQRNPVMLFSGEMPYAGPHNSSVPDLLSLRGLEAGQLRSHGESTQTMSSATQPAQRVFEADPNRGNTSKVQDNSARVRGAIAKDKEKPSGSLDEG